MRRLVLLPLLLAALVWCWGPHPQIVDAALSSLPPEDRLTERLGADAARLRQYVWLGDWRNQLIAIQESWFVDRTHIQMPVQFYSNDFLIFPLSRVHTAHIVPGVLDTYRPFFLRSLQALRTETPSNAARWIGSLLHFTTDTGSPPHAAGILGDAHVKMENWLDGSQIRIPGYRPASLGATDEDAVRGFQRRMDGLIEFSKQREVRLRPLIAANDESGSHPIALESAIETARVTADLMHTLLTLSAQPPAPRTASLYAEITASSIATLEALPAKLVLVDTLFSTLSEAKAIRSESYSGTFEFRNLPPGTYRPVVSRVGCKTVFFDPIELSPGKTVSRRWELAADEVTGNLVRNPDFRIRWVSKDAPDHWTYDGRKQTWTSDHIKVDQAKKYRIVVLAAEGAAPKVSLQWLGPSYPYELGPAIADLPAELHLTAPPKTAYVRLVIHGRADPAVTLRKLALATE